MLRQLGDDGHLTHDLPRRWPRATAALTAAFALAYALDVRSRVRTGLGPEALPARWVFDGAHPRAWHLVSYAFVHADATHLVANLVVLALAGACVERRIGARATLAAALALTVAACACFHPLDPRDLYGASGLCAGLVALGLGMQSPALACVGLALTAYGLACEASRTQRVVALFAGALLTSTLRLHFLWEGFCAYLDPHRASLWATGVVIVVALIDRAPMAMVVLCWRRAPAYVPLWLPPAWLLGERLWAAVTHLPLDAWMLTQGRTPTVLHAIAWLAACALSAALASRVPARHRGAEALRGVVALRLSRFVGTLAPIDGAEIVVWPETSMRSDLALPREGAVTGARLPPLMRGGGRAEHLIGTFSRRPDRVQNVAAVVDADGALRWMRAKRRLMLVGEAPLLGHMLPGVSVLIGPDGTVRARADRGHLRHARLPAARD